MPHSAVVIDGVVFSPNYSSIRSYKSLVYMTENHQPFLWSSWMSCVTPQQSTGVVVDWLSADACGIRSGDPQTCWRSWMLDLRLLPLPTHIAALSSACHFRNRSQQLFSLWIWFTGWCTVFWNFSLIWGRWYSSSWSRLSAWYWVPNSNGTH